MMRSQENIETVERDMMVRAEHIQQTCIKYQLRSDDLRGCTYKSVDERFDQNIGDNFLADPRTGTLYCFIHKVKGLKRWLIFFLEKKNQFQESACTICKKFLMEGPFIKSRVVSEAQFQMGAAPQKA